MWLIIICILLFTGAFSLIFSAIFEALGLIVVIGLGIWLWTTHQLLFWLVAVVIIGLIIIGACSSD